MPISVQVINSVPCVVRTAWHNHERDRALPSLPALWRSCMLLVVVLSIEEELRWVPGLVGASAESYCARVTVGVRFVSPRLLSEHVGSAEDAVPSSRIAWGFGIVPLLASSTVLRTKGRHRRPAKNKRNHKFQTRKSNNNLESVFLRSRNILGPAAGCMFPFAEQSRRQHDLNVSRSRPSWPPQPSMI